MTAQDAYESLAAAMGFPGSARLRRVFENLMTPEQAQMVAALKMKAVQPPKFIPGAVA